MIALIALLASITREREPTYQGKPLHYWVNAFDMPVSWEHTEAEKTQAIQSIGTSALPSLLTDYFDLASPGVYRVSFKGKLPSVTEVGQEVEFETTPLVITIVATNSRTGAEFPKKNR